MAVSYATDLLQALGLAESDAAPEVPPAKDLDCRIKIAGFGGQGVLMLGELLAEAGLES